MGDVIWLADRRNRKKGETQEPRADGLPHDPMERFRVADAELQSLLPLRTAEDPLTRFQVADAKLEASLRRLWPERYPQLPDDPVERFEALDADAQLRLHRLWPERYPEPKGPA